MRTMPPAVHPGRLLKRELTVRELSANRLALDTGVPSGRVTDILNGRRSITAGTAVRLGRYFANSAQFWLDLQSQYDIAVVERESGCRNHPPRAAGGRGVKENKLVHCHSNSHPSAWSTGSSSVAAKSCSPYERSNMRDRHCPR